MFSRSVLIGLRWIFFQDLIMSRDLINKKDNLFSVKKKLKLGIDDESVLKDIQTTSKTAEKEDVRLRALFKLSDILDLEDKTSTKVTTVTGALFQGFTPEKLEEVERPQLEEGGKDGG